VNCGGGESSSSPQLLENGGARLRIALDVIETGEARVPFIVPVVSQMNRREGVAGGGGF
jgi:hypothetical protein